MPGATTGVDVPGVLWGAEIPGVVGTVGNVGIAVVGLLEGEFSCVLQSGTAPVAGGALLEGPDALADGTQPGAGKIILEKPMVLPAGKLMLRYSHRSVLV